MRNLIIFLSVFLTLSNFAQKPNREEVVDFTKEGKELISYLQFTLNAIGNNELSPKEKDIIISESYLKMFRDAKVQIEDDLDVSREAVTNKDVQAYLKDVDFFFKYANFTFTILSIDLQTDENGKPFLLTNLLRSLDAIDYKGDTIKNIQQRFIEIELNSDKRELKIASIYTTMLNENEENIRWWNILPKAWKAVLGTRANVSDSLAFSSIMILDENYFILKPKETNKVGEESLEYKLAFNYDTIWLNDSSKFEQKESVFKALNRILEITDLNLSGNLEITDIEPLNRLRNIRSLDVSHTQIQNIDPVRNLTKLNKFICANTNINSVDALSYSTSLAILDISNNSIYDIKPLANLEKLVLLDVSNTNIESIVAIANMKLLGDLKMTNTSVEDLSPLSTLSSLKYLDLNDNEQLKSIEALKHLNQLKTLYCNNTMVNDLTPLSNLPNLETIYCENSEITSLSGLELMPKLKKIYCDNSFLGKQKAIDFMKEHPLIVVVYESEQLLIWWNKLPEVWKTVFTKTAKLDTIVPPTKEQLHELTAIKEINVSGNTSISSLQPLNKLKNLQKLNAAKTSITSLDGISEAREMRELNISNTNIQQLYALESLNLMEELSISYCPVKDINPLLGMVNLKKLIIDNSMVDNISYLEELKNLRYLYADNTQVDRQRFEDFNKLEKDILIVFQSEELINWWGNLSAPWKKIFMNHMRWAQDPKTEDLHKLILIRSLEITENRSIIDLEPIGKLWRLSKLKVNDTKITDLSPLKNLSYLKEVDFSRNPIRDLSSLQSLANLEVIYINNTPIDNLEWLLSLPQIKTLDISGTEIKNLKELNYAIHLEKLIAYNTKINNIKPLEDLPDLILLKIYNTNVSEKKIEAFKEKKPKCEVDFY